MDAEITADDRFVIPRKTGIYAYWIASPSSASNQLMANNTTILGNTTTTQSYFGLRPIVCLTSQAELVEKEDAYYVELKK